MGRKYSKYMFIESINSEIKAKKEQQGHEKYCPICKIELLEHLPRVYILKERPPVDNKQTFAPSLLKLTLHTYKR